MIADYRHFDPPGVTAMPATEDYQTLLRRAIYEHTAIHRQKELPLYELASNVLRIQSSLPGGALSTEWEGSEQWAPLYLELDLALLRACHAMRMSVFLIDEPLREAERKRVISELEALGMFS